MSTSIVTRGSLCGESALPRCATPLIAYYDAAVEPFNPGGHAVGAHIVLAHDACGLTDDVEGTAYYGCGPDWTANRAEYCAAVGALRAVWRLGYRGPVELRGDSLLVANHYNRTWACGAPHLVPLLERLHRAAAVLRSPRPAGCGERERRLMSTAILAVLAAAIDRCASPGVCRQPAPHAGRKVY
jgi:ribonuclease HI